MLNTSWEDENSSPHEIDRLWMTLVDLSVKMVLFLSRIGSYTIDSTDGGLEMRQVGFGSFWLPNQF